MPLDKIALKQSILNLQNSLKTYNGTDGKAESDAAEKFANDLATYIDNYVKQALVTVTIPAGTVIIAATGGVPNPLPIPLNGSPDTNTGGIS